jgi:hypothetical protein
LDEPTHDPTYAPASILNRSRIRALATVAAAAVAVDACTPGKVTPPATDVNGTWTGTAKASEDQIGLRLLLTQGADGSIGGELRFQDPDQGAWYYAGDVSGTLSSGADLSLQTDAGVRLQLVIQKNSATGTGALPDSDGGIPVAVTASKE